MKFIAFCDEIHLIYTKQLSGSLFKEGDKI